MRVFCVNVCAILCKIVSILFQLIHTLGKKEEKCESSVRLVNNNNNNNL